MPVARHVARVRLRELQSMAALNGHGGTVVAFDASKGRYRVRIDAADGDDVERPRVMALARPNATARDCVGEA